MKILHLSTEIVPQSPSYRLHKGLLNIGIDSKVVTGSADLVDDFNVIKPTGKLAKTQRIISAVFDRFALNFYIHKKKFPFSISMIPDNLLRRINILNSDLVHLHWICHGFMKIETLNKINKPIIWTLHDSWPFTGGCHIPFECNKYRVFCNACPQLGSNSKYDLSSLVYSRKVKTYKNLLDNMIIVSPSSAMKEAAQNSSLLKDFEIEIIPNTLDTDIFKPINKDMAREILNLNKERKIILFGARYALSDKNKGFHFLLSALKILSKKIKDIELIVFGASKPEQIIDIAVPTRYLGMCYDEVTLALLYSSADITVVPSMHESLSYVTLESLSCATPVAAFNVGGIPDMIEHKKNGYLAVPYEIEDLANGMEWILSDEKRFKHLCIDARQTAVNGFNPEIIANKHLQLYKKICHT